MNPDDKDKSPQIAPAHKLVSQLMSAPGPKSATQPKPNDNRDQAANIIRHQIDNIYDGNTAPTDSLEVGNPYERTHSDNTQIEADEWKAYHSAWQNYYRQYYEGYYKQRNTDNGQGKTYFSSQPPLADRVEDADETVSKDEALYTLRQKLLQTVRHRAQKVRKSRHFVPIISALAVMVIFAFVQYNQFLVAQVMAYVSPGQIDPNNIVVDPSVNVEVGPDPKLIIPKINVDVPVYYDIGNDYDSQMAAMAKGVAQFAIPGASSHPGENGNTVIAGHSSNDLFDGGDYKFIFSQLERLQVGDSIYADYHGVRYTYIVSKTQVVKPTDVSALVMPNDKPVITLLTCTPLGTALNRLLVFADQVSPDPKAATASTGSSSAVQPATIPGTQPTLFEKLFGSKGN